MFANILENIIPKTNVINVPINIQKYDLINVLVVESETITGPALAEDSLYSE
jgi:hypothetical protein